MSFVLKQPSSLTLRVPCRANNLGHLHRLSGYITYNKQRYRNRKIGQEVEYYIQGKPSLIINILDLRDQSPVFLFQYNLDKDRSYPRAHWYASLLITLQIPPQKKKKNCKIRSCVRRRVPHFRKLSWIPSLPLRETWGWIFCGVKRGKIDSWNCVEQSMESITKKWAMPSKNSDINDYREATGYRNRFRGVDAWGFGLSSLRQPYLTTRPRKPVPKCKGMRSSSL